MKNGTDMTKTKEITTSVTKKIGQPNFGSASVLVSITSSVDDGDDVDMAYAGDWALCWEQIDKQEEELKKRTKVPEAPVETPTTPPLVPVQEPSDPIMDATAPICPIHKVKAVWRPAGVSKAGKPYPGFYGCPGKNPDGTFCKQKFT